MAFGAIVVRSAEARRALRNAGAILGIDVRCLVLWTAISSGESDSRISRLHRHNPDFRIAALSRWRLGFARDGVVSTFFAVVAVVVRGAEVVPADQNARAILGTHVVLVLLR